MAYPVYNRAEEATASQDATYYNNKGVLVVPSLSAGNAEVYFYGANGMPGSTADLKTSAGGSPYVVPIRIQGFGDISNCAVFELL